MQGPSCRSSQLTRTCRRAWHRINRQLGALPSAWNIAQRGPCAWLPYPCNAVTASASALAELDYCRCGGSSTLQNHRIAIVLAHSAARTVRRPPGGRRRGGSGRDPPPTSYRTPDSSGIVRRTAWKKTSRKPRSCDAFAVLDPRSRRRTTAGKICAAR